MNDFSSTARERFAKMDIPELIKEINHRVFLSYAGGWGVWGVYRRQIDKALIEELRERPIDLSAIDKGDWTRFDFSQLVDYDESLQKIIQRGEGVTEEMSHEREQKILDMSHSVDLDSLLDSADKDDLPF